MSSVDVQGMRAGCNAENRFFPPGRRCAALKMVVFSEFSMYCFLKGDGAMMTALNNTGEAASHNHMEWVMKETESILY